MRLLGPLSIVLASCLFSYATSLNASEISMSKNRADLSVTEVMTRYPSVKSPGGILRGLDYLGTVAFASGGTIAAGCKGMDLLGCIVIGTVTAIGGGTTRDILLGQTPVFWMIEVEYLTLCIITSIVTFYTWPFLAQSSAFSLSKIYDDGILPRWLDTIGLGAFSVVGTQHGIRKRCHPFISVIVCAITCSFGGIFRDVFLKNPIRVFHSHQEAYLSTAIIGSVAYLASRILIENSMIRILIGFMSTIAARMLSWKYNIRLPEM